MPFRTARTHLQDILEGIAHIEDFVSGMALPEYESDLKTQSAVERQLQIITEGAYRLGDQADEVCPGPDWKGWMGMGNILRHAYHRVEPKIVWDTVTTEMPSLKESVSKAVVALSDAEKQDPQ